MEGGGCRAIGRHMFSVVEIGYGARRVGDDRTAHV